MPRGSPFEQLPLEQAAAWRKLIIRQDLLRTTPLETSHQGRGVSLAYLEGLAASLTEIRHDACMPESTGDIWQQVVMPVLARASGKRRQAWIDMD